MNLSIALRQIFLTEMILCTGAHKRIIAIYCLIQLDLNCPLFRHPSTPEMCAKIQMSSFSTLNHGGGGSSIVKTPGDVPSTRVYFFGPLVRWRDEFSASFSQAHGVLYRTLSAQA